MEKRALITGITGQDGSYLAELLLKKGYEVHGIIRRASTFNTSRLDHIFQDPHHSERKLFLHYGDLSSTEWLIEMFSQIHPQEIYHLAAQSHVRVSFDLPDYTCLISGLGAARLLHAVRISGVKARVYQASSSEMFGASAPPQDETTPFQPRSPYAASKLYAHWMARMYREGYGLHICSGILFNHESPRRGETFVTRKITRAIAGILAGKERKIYMGNLEAKRDWGYAPEYVEVMWRMLQQDVPEDFVIGTGESHSVREFLQEAFHYVGLQYEAYVETDPRYLRPLEVEHLIANPQKARRLLGWQPKVRFRDLVRIMVDADMLLAGLSPPGEGMKLLEKLSLPGASQQGGP